MLKKRSTAFAILAIVVVLGTLFGVHRTMASKRNAAAAIFLQGADGDGYGIENKLEQRRDKASNLAKLGRMNNLDDAADAVQAACEALDSAEEPAEKYAANRDLTAVCDTLSDALEGASLTDEQEKSRSSLMADLESYELQLERLAADYNAAAEAFNEKELGAFPCGILARLTGVRKLEVFA